MDLFITCSHGLEGILANELQQLGCERVSEGFRGVLVKEADPLALYRINYGARIGSRVLLPLSRFRCYDQKSLYRELINFDWDFYIPKNKTFAIDANVNHPKLRNSLFAAQVAKDAICDRIRQKRGERPNIDVKNPDVQLNLFIDRDVGVMSFDTSGKPLYKRGYRLESVEAPLQESLAASILTLANYQGEEVLCDPCCGSGTFLIEAALIASKTPPGYLRKDWGFHYLPEFSQTEWLKVKGEADSKRCSPPLKRLFGVDVNKNAIHMCKVNLRAAGFHQAVELTNADFRDFKPDVPPQLVVTNPPHGKRMESIESLRPLYRALGDFMKRQCAKPARGFIFTGSLELTKEVGLAAKRRYVMTSGGVESRLLEFDLY